MHIKILVDAITKSKSAYGIYTIYKTEAFLTFSILVDFIKIRHINFAALTILHIIVVFFFFNFTLILYSLIYQKHKMYAR